MISLLAEYATSLDLQGNHAAADVVDSLVRSAASGKKGDKLDQARHGAILAFMGWLTTREDKAGPFSGRDNASEAAELVGDFCEAQGWVKEGVEPDIPTWKNPDPESKQDWWRKDKDIEVVGDEE